MINITFGFRTDSIHDAIVGRGLRLSREFMNIIGPVSNLVDYVPLLQKFPASMRDRGHILHTDLVEAYVGLVRKLTKECRPTAKSKAAW